VLISRSLIAAPFAGTLPAPSEVSCGKIAGLDDGRKLEPIFLHPLRMVPSQPQQARHSRHSRQRRSQTRSTRIFTAPVYPPPVYAARRALASCRWPSSLAWHFSPAMLKSPKIAGVVHSNHGETTRRYASYSRQAFRKKKTDAHEAPAQAGTGVPSGSQKISPCRA
jgi:hypothetical protein